MTQQEYHITVDAYADRLYRFAYSRLRCASDAKDVVQSAFIRLWQRHADVSYESARSYLFSAAHSALIDWVRTHKRYGGGEPLPQQTATDDAAAYEARQSIEHGMQYLSDIQRTVLLLRDYEGYPYADIARMTELTESQVKVYIFRARKNLRKHLEAEAKTRNA